METQVAGSSFNVTGIPPWDLQMVWPQVGELLAGAVARNYGEMTLQDVVNRILQQKYHLWVAFNEEGLIQAAAVVEVRQKNRLRVGHYVLVAGWNITKWMGCDELIVEWAKEQGCDFMQAFTRPGVTKKAKALGYKHMYDVIGKPIGVLH